MKLLLFDVDGTLTPARRKITENMVDMLNLAKKEYVLGFVGGSDLAKQQEQLGDAIHLFTYWFPQNGVQGYKDGIMFHDNNMVSTIGEERYQSLVNDCMRELSSQVLPFKRGTFIEHRTGMMNVAPAGRACSGVERDQFEKHDHEHKEGHEHKGHGHDHEHKEDHKHKKHDHKHKEEHKKGHDHEHKKEHDHKHDHKKKHDHK